MLKIDILRHGQTDSNTQGRYLGRTDVPLNATGLLQAHSAARRLSAIAYDTIYASPLARAWETAQIVARPHGLEVQRLDGIAERDFGIFDNLTYQEIGEKYAQERKEWEENWDTYVPPGGESAVDARQRVAQTLEELKAKRGSGHLLLVSHLALARQMIAHLLGLPVDAGWHFMLDNTGIARFEIENGNGVLTKLG